MTLFFVGIVLLDGWLDGSLSASTPNKPVQGTILCLLVVLLAIPAQMEFAKLAAAKNLKVFTSVSTLASILFATTWYLPQLFTIPQPAYTLSLLAFTFFALLLYQYIVYGTSGTIANCGTSFLSIVYLGVLSGFVLAVRVDFGLWPLLMLISVVKFADIGAYTVGRLFGRHKFAPGISPGKTWEGMAGAVAAAVIVSILFAAKCDIMAWQLAIVFGVCFAFIGQLGDLAESMLKRDAQQKDSSDTVPGFGGILDVIDSPLVSAVFAYLFFTFTVSP